jgi:hypothetical protein
MRDAGEHHSTKSVPKTTGLSQYSVRLVIKDN